QGGDRERGMVTARSFAPGGVIHGKPPHGVLELGSPPRVAKSSQGVAKARRRSDGGRGRARGKLALREAARQGADNSGVPHPRPARGSGERPPASAWRPEATRVARGVAPQRE